MKEMPEKKKWNYTQQCFFHDVKVVMATVALFTFAFSFYVNSREREWKLKWGQCHHAQVKAQVRNMLFETRLAQVGNQYERLDKEQFVKMVAKCSDNNVNNVHYVGSSAYYDYFIHDCDCWTHRIMIKSCVPTTISLTEDVTRWISIMSVPTETASKLRHFLDGVDKK